MGMYILVKGRINIFQGTPDSQEEPSLVSSLKAGDFFGELALVKQEPIAICLPNPLVILSSWVFPA